jgi:hypothetical protein
MKFHDINEIQADYREQRSVFFILWGLFGTYRRIITECKYDKMKLKLDKTTGLVNHIVYVVYNQGQTLQAINQDFDQIQGQNTFDAIWTQRPASEAHTSS